MVILTILQHFALFCHKTEWKCKLNKKEFPLFLKKKETMLIRENCVLCYRRYEMSVCHSVPSAELPAKLFIWPGQVWIPVLLNYLNVLFLLLKFLILTWFFGKKIRFLRHKILEIDIISDMSSDWLNQTILANHHYFEILSLKYIELRPNK